MIDNTFKCRSVCSVSMDYNERLWLNRLADINDHYIDAPYKSGRDTTCFENRDRLYKFDGPSQVGAIGVWDWEATANFNDPSADYIQSFFEEEIRPVRVLILPHIKSLNALKSALISGSISSSFYLCDTLFCFESSPNIFMGLLCKADEISYNDRNIKLVDTVYFLPCYTIKSYQIYNCENINLNFLKDLEIEEPEDYVFIKDFNKLIYDVLSERISRPFYTKTIGRTKREWRECKELFQMICDPSLYEDVAEKLNCPIENIKEQVDSFINRVDFSLDIGDIDAEILARIATNNENLRLQCERIVESRWKEAHSAEISNAEAEIEKIKKDLNLALIEKEEQLSLIADDKRTAESRRDSVLNEISKSQERLDSLLKEIKNYEKLGTDTIEAIRIKISDAKKDMATFIAELTVLESFESNSGKHFDNRNSWTFTQGKDCSDLDSPEICNSWKDTIEILQDNLQQAGVNDIWNIMLSSFLYSAYINKMPILLAGPNAQFIADALSMAVCAKHISTLECCGEKDCSATKLFEEEEIAAVENPFHPDWINMLSRLNTNKFFIWLHPFYEDLRIEPKTLYNYVYPIFTECFVDDIPSEELVIAGTKEYDYQNFKSSDKRRSKMKLIKEIGANKLLVNQLNKVISDAKCIADIEDDRFEYLFGALPLSILFGKEDLLAEAIEDKVNLPTEITNEIKRYIEE